MSPLHQDVKASTAPHGCLPGLALITDLTSSTKQNWFCNAVGGVRVQQWGRCRSTSRPQPQLMVSLAHMSPLCSSNKPRYICVVHACLSLTCIPTNMRLTCSMHNHSRVRLICSSNKPRCSCQHQLTQRGIILIFAFRRHSRQQL